MLALLIMDAHVIPSARLKELSNAENVIKAK